MGRALLAALLCLLVLAPASARAEEPVNVRWETLLPPADSPITPQVKRIKPECRKVSIKCMDGVIRRLKRAADRYGCDHRAVFPRVYQLLSEELRRYIRQKGFFDDRRYLILEAVMFERFYRLTMGAWERGDLEAVPAAWRVALETYRDGDTLAAQDMLLGINAHVQRDMPFVVAYMGLRFPDGRSRKPDHDRDNLVLDRAYEAIVRRVESEYDPMTAYTNSPLTPADDYLGLEMTRTWREGVWRNAERLLNAGSDAEREQVAQSIELQAEASARMIAASRTPGYGAQRDAYCRSKRQPA
jgi:hypothetical protein